MKEVDNMRFHLCGHTFLYFADVLGNGTIIIWRLFCYSIRHVTDVPSKAGVHQIKKLKGIATMLGAMPTSMLAVSDDWDPKLSSMLVDSISLSERMRD